MTNPVEAIAQADAQVRHVISLLTNADQALEQVLAHSKEYQENVPNAHDLASAIEIVRKEVGVITAKHNELVAQLHEAARHAAEHAAEEARQRHEAGE